ncbi:MAG: cupin domain-containing protein [Planctomycetes bacterium]|nr:cupin domain-containing protein [Planctomycetota bacterium]
MKDGPPALPPGAQFAVLEGNPKEAEFFTMRLKLPAGYKVPPHQHPAIERVTVLSGQLHVALGDTFDPSKAKELKAGSYMKIPPRTNHYAFTKEETILQLTTIGPWEVIYVNPADDPRKKK